jgi:hypothetical protein
MPALVAGIHVLLAAVNKRKTWMAGTRPGHDVEGASLISD